MKKLQTLEEHNQNKIEHYELQKMFPLKNGIACPECGVEMVDSNPSMVLTSHPPKKEVHCLCGFRGYALI